ncbi:MAG: hypothetical protein WBI40_10905 [Methylococcaceae bacterium]
MNDTNKKTGVSFECTERQRESYIKAAGGRKLGVWIQSVLDAELKRQRTLRNPKANELSDDEDSIGNH